MKSIQRKDKGIYTCTIHQSRGSESTSEKSQSINVKVIGKMTKKYRFLNVLNHQYKVKNKQSMIAQRLLVNNFECSKKF